MWTGLRIKQNQATEIPIPWGPEDRVSFNPENVVAIQVQSRWKVADGDHWILDFDQNRIGAERAVAVIKHYGLSSTCYVGRPACPGEQPMTYWLDHSGNAPAGAMAQEDAIAFTPATVTVRQIGQRWKVADGNNWLLDFGPAEGNAKLALYFIKKYGFTHICYVSRPNPPMTYFRK